MSAKLKIPEKGLFGLPSSVRQIDNEEIKSTQVLENSSTTELENSGTEVPEYLNTKVPENPSTEGSKYQDTETLNNSDTQEPKNLSTEIPNNSNTEVLEDQDTKVSKIHSTKDFKYLSTQVLPKTQKNNRAKDEKKPARKQASVHLSGSTLKALHLFAYEEGLEKSEVMEKALRKFIPKKYFE